MSTTWNEFKTIVDKRLEEQGNDGDVELDYIDVSYGELIRPDGIDVFISVVDGRLSIC